MNKRGELNIWMIAGAILAIVLVTNPGLIGFQKAGAAEVPVVPVDTQQTADAVEFCSDSSITMTVGPTKQKWSPATSTATVQHRWLKNGVDQGLVTEANTKSVAWKDRIEVIYAANSTAYYASKPATITAPCAAFSTSEHDGNFNELYANGTLATWNVFNTDATVNSQTSNETINSGESKTFKVSIFGDSEKGVSPYGKLHLVLEENVTAFDEGQAIMTGSSSGTNPSGTLYKLANVASSLKTFDFDGGPKGDVRQYNLETFLTVKAKSGVNPNAAATGAETLLLTALADDWCQSSDDANLVRLAVEDEDGNGRVGGTVAGDTCGANHLRQVKTIYYN